jgi:hypothetical protein
MNTSRWLIVCLVLFMFGARVGWVQSVQDTNNNVQKACEASDGFLNINKIKYLCFTQEQFAANVKYYIYQYIKNHSVDKSIPPSPGT